MGWLPNLGYVILFAFAWGVWTGLVLSRLERRRLTEETMVSCRFKRLCLAYRFYRNGFSWRLAWWRAGQVRRGEWT